MESEILMYKYVSIVVPGWLRNQRPSDSCVRINMQYKSQCTDNSGTSVHNECACLYSGIAFIRLWFNSYIVQNRTKFQVPGQALYISIEKSLVSSNGYHITWNILEEHIITKMFR